MGFARGLAGGLCLVLLASLAAPMVSEAAGTLLSYPTFSDLTGLSLEQAAVQAGDRLRLTQSLSQAGAVYTTDPVSLTDGFSTAFSFQFTQPSGCFDTDGVQGADGMVFVVRSGNTGVGIGGAGIGYQGLADSLGVEFDTWNNGSWDEQNGNHVGVNLAGEIDSVVQAALSTPMNNGATWYAWVDYDAQSDQLEVRLAQSNARPASPTLSYTVDIPAAVGGNAAYVGFTSGTGCAGNHHDLLSWEYRDEYSPIGACRAGSSLAFAAPLSSGGTASMTAGGTLAIGFTYAACTVDDSVTVRIRDSATNQLIAGYTYGHQISFDPGSGLYHLAFDSSQYSVSAGQTLRVLVYFGNQLRGSALVHLQ